MKKELSLLPIIAKTVFAGKTKTGVYILAIAVAIISNKTGISLEAIADYAAPRIPDTEKLIALAGVVTLAIGIIHDIFKKSIAVIAEIKKTIKK